MTRIKLSVIRGEGVKKCPFGLDIIDACKNAGSSVKNMMVVSEDSNISNINKDIYLKLKENIPCIYADKILEKYNKVDCDYGDTGAKFHSVDLGNSPTYPRIFSDTTTIPYGYYADNNESRNLFYGLYSLIGKNLINEIIKLADKYDVSGEIDKANKLDILLVKLKDLMSNGG